MKENTLKCRNCGSIDATPLYHVPVCESFSYTGIDSLDIYRCKKCQLVSSGLDLDDETAKIIYSDKYPSEEDDESRQNSFSSVLNMLDTMKQEKGKLLDIGCGYGSFMSMALKYKWAVEGMDISSYAAENASQELGVPVFVGTLDQSDYPEDCFDVITLLDVIEHLNDPRVFLCEVRRILKPEGVLVMRTPNQDSLFHWIAGLSARIGWDYPAQQIYHIDHLTYFTKSSLMYLLNQEGFNINKVEYETIDDKRFLGLKKVAISILRVVAAVLKKQSGMAAYCVLK